MGSEMKDLYSFATRDGIIIPDTNGVLANVTESMKTALGRNLITEPETPEGRLIEFLAMAFKSVLGVTAQNANQQNIHTATGAYLDGHGTIYDMPRKRASKSEVVAKFTGVPNQIVGAGFVVSSDESSVRFVLAGDVELDATGIGYGTMYSEFIGGFECPAGHLTEIETSTTTVSAVTNEADAIPGSEADETDEHYRARLVQALSTGRDFVASIKNRILNVDRVTSCVVYENGDSVDRVIGNTVVSAHSIFVCVDGGDDEKVARAIYSAKSAGCGYTNLSSTFSNTPPVERVVKLPDSEFTVTTADVQKIVLVKDESNETDETYPVLFYRPTAYIFPIEVTISRNLYAGADLAKAVKDAVTEFVNQLGVGANVTSIDIGQAVSEAVPSVRVRSVSIGGVSSIPAYGYIKPKATDTSVTVRVI